jgi:hypothetical protein
MENEIMNVTNEVMDSTVVTDGQSGIGTGAAIAIGAGIATAVFCGVKLAKKAFGAFKAKKAELTKDNEPEITDEE